MARTRRERSPLDEALGVSRVEDRPADAPVPEPTPDPVPVEEDGGGGFLGLGDKDSFLRQALRSAVPLAVTGMAPGAGAQQFQQQFFGKQDELAQLGREQEAARAATQRENALLLWETFQNNPASFAAMPPESILPIAEAAAETMQRPVEEIIQLMQAQAAQAAQPSTGQLTSLVGTLGGLGQAGPAQQALQQIPGFEDTQITPAENLADLDPDEAARIKENFTDDSANAFFQAIDGGASVAQAGELLKFRPGGKDTTLREQMAGQAVAMMEAGQKPDPLLQQAFNDYFNVEKSGLSSATIAGVYSNVQGLAALLASMNPDDPRSVQMLEDSAGVARKILDEVDAHQKKLKRPLLPAEMEAYVAARGQALLQQPQPAVQEIEDSALDAAIAKAQGELGIEASEDDVMTRAEEILGVDQK